MKPNLYKMLFDLIQLENRLYKMFFDLIQIENRLYTRLFDFIQFEKRSYTTLFDWIQIEHIKYHMFFDWIQIENLGVVDALPFNTLWKQELKNWCSVYLFRNVPHVSNAWLCTKTMLQKKCWGKHIPVLILHNCHQRQGKVQVYKQCMQNDKIW